MAEITLYGAGTSRSARCRWALLESGLAFEYIDDPSLIRSDALREMQPLAKLPVMRIDDALIFESAAICTYVSDLAPEAGLIDAPGTRARALHEQWTSFVLTELEAYLWSNAKHTGINPEARRLPAITAFNQYEIDAAVQVLEDALAAQPYLTGARFTVTDIIAGWTINWARRAGHLEARPHLQTYLARLFERPHCTLNRE